MYISPVVCWGGYGDEIHRCKRFSVGGCDGDASSVVSIITEYYLVIHPSCSFHSPYRDGDGEEKREKRIEKSSSTTDKTQLPQIKYKKTAHQNNPICKNPHQIESPSSLLEKPNPMEEVFSIRYIGPSIHSYQGYGSLY